MTFVSFIVPTDSDNRKNTSGIETWTSVIMQITDAVISSGKSHQEE